MTNMLEAGERQRIEWIDVAKGIGILLVAATHVFGGSIAKYSEWFYMPLFFFLSGYLYVPAEEWHRFVTKRARHLLLPYAGCYFRNNSITGTVTFGRCAGRFSTMDCSELSPCFA